MTPIDQADMRNSTTTTVLAGHAITLHMLMGSKLMGCSCNKRKAQVCDCKNILFSCELNLNFYWLNVKFTSIWVTTSTGSPFRRVGLYTHCETADRAASTSNGWPVTNCRFWMAPSFPMMAVKRTVP